MRLDFSAISGRKVFLDKQYMPLTNNPGRPPVNNSNVEYATSSLRQQLLAYNCQLQDKAEDADIIVEARMGAMGSDSNELTYGLPTGTVMRGAIAAVTPGGDSLPVFPDLSLGTSVLVLPWYHPLRLAEEIAMLNSLTQGTLHLGIGRGTDLLLYVLVIAVKPQDAPALMADLGPKIPSGKLVVSICAGLPTSFFEKRLPVETPVVRVMSNTPALVDRAMSAISAGSHASGADLALTEEMLSPLGKTLRAACRASLRRRVRSGSS